MNKSSGLGHVVKTSKCTEKEFSDHFVRALRACPGGTRRTRTSLQCLCVSVASDRNQGRHRRRRRACAQPCAKRQPPRLIFRASSHEPAVSAFALFSQHGMTVQQKTHASLAISSWLRKGAVGCANSQHIATVKISCGTHTAQGSQKLWYQQVVKRRGRYGLLSTVTSSASAIQPISDAIAHWCALFAVKWHLLNFKSAWESSDAFSSYRLQTAFVVHTRKKVRGYGRRSRRKGESEQGS